MVASVGQARAKVIDPQTTIGIENNLDHARVRKQVRDRWPERGAQHARTAGEALTTGDAYVLDDQGHLAFATQTGSGIVVRTQPNFGAPVITVTTLPTTGTVGGFGADAAGTGTVLVSETATRQTIDFVGPLCGGAGWTRQLVLANASPAYRPTDFKVSASGSAAFVWQPSATADIPVFANTRATNSASWSAPTKLSGPVPHYDIDWLAVAANNAHFCERPRRGRDADRHRRDDEHARSCKCQPRRQPLVGTHRVVRPRRG